ncbi:YuiB family protein [Alkalibacillus haloalkaliphilus]|uniref:YuiB family protein n=1 Tax=Alkalibacillus haloalkaliphilus TaxID=94136 RepID=UPI0002E92197|nr:YuiB family protein [Alkalibacillus haloalkaliphilus]
MGIIQVFVLSVLFFILFFGIAFILNMLLRSTWVMAVVFPIVVVFIVDDVPFTSYFTQPGEAFPALWDDLISLQAVDMFILLTGFAGTIVSGIVIKILRKNGYQMF